MVRLGWMQDSHINDEESSDTSGASYSMLYEDIDTLDSFYGVDDIYFTGDLVAPSKTGQVPHAKPSYFDEFWRLVDQANNPDLVRYATPGNHDVPLGVFLDSDPRCVLRKRIDYPDDGVSVFLVNTHAHGYVTGSPGQSADDQSNIGPDVPLVPYRDLKWLDEQMADAGSNAKIVLPHAEMVPHGSGIGPDTGPHGRLQYLSTSELNWYEVVRNFHLCEEILSKYNKVVVANSHTRPGGQGSTTINGVDYAWKKHYWGFSDPPSVRTFGYFDVTSSGVTLKTVEHSDGTEYTLLDKTF